MSYRVKLNSDFWDYYDVAAHVTEYDAVLNRRMDSGPDRVTMLTMLHALNFEVPKNGIVKDLYTDILGGFENKEALDKSEYGKIMELVVYLDVKSHCGDSKLKLSLEEAFEKHPNCFASQFLPSKSSAGVSWRYLSVGDAGMWMKYTSKDDWRSNCGDVTIEKVNVSYGKGEVYNFDAIDAPLYAIDFIPIEHKRDIILHAVDFNVSPGLRGTPAEEYFRAEEVMELISAKMERVTKGNR